MKIKILMLNSILFLLKFNLVLILLCVVATYYKNMTHCIVHIFGYEMNIILALFLQAVIFFCLDLNLRPKIISLKKMMQSSNNRKI
jgi:hypothetical protein